MSLPAGPSFSTFPLVDNWEIDRAGPVFRERTRIELVRLRDEVPADRGLEHDVAGGVEAAPGLFQFELGERDFLRRAAELEGEVGDLLGRSDR